MSRLAVEPSGRTIEDVENALTVAALAHMTAKTPATRDAAWTRLLEIRAERERLNRKAVPR